METKLNLFKARYYHCAASIFYELKKYLKAISYSTQALSACKGILDNACIETLRFKEVMASSYNAMEQRDEALTYYEAIYFGLNVQIKTMQQNKNEQKQQTQNELNKDYSLHELNIWKGDIVYNIAMILMHRKNSKKQRFSQNNV